MSFIIKAKHVLFKGLFFIICLWHHIFLFRYYMMVIVDGNHFFLKLRISKIPK